MSTLSDTTATKPVLLRFDVTTIEQIPAELRHIPRWVCWKGVYDEGRKKWGKPPFDPETGRMVDYTNAAALNSFDDVVKQYSQHQDMVSGIGFVFPDEGLTGIDFDNVRDPASGECVDDWAKRWIERLNSYTEVSPSRTGFKVWIRAKKPGQECGNKKFHVEIYDNKRFFTLTGQRLHTVSKNIESRQEELDELYGEAFGDVSKASESDKASSSENSPDPIPLKLEDEQLLKTVLANGNGKKVELLWQGKWQDAGYQSESEADLAFCGFLAKDIQDAGTIDRIYRGSKLLRNKWDERHGEKTYGELTIEKALAGRDNVVRAGHGDRYYLGDSGNMMVEHEKHGQREHRPITSAGNVIVEEVIQYDSIKHYKGKIRNGNFETSFELPASAWVSKQEFCKEIKGRGGEKIIFRGSDWEHLAQGSEQLCRQKKFLRARPFGWDKNFTSFFGVDCMIEHDGVRVPKEEFFNSKHKNTKRLRLAFPKSKEQVVKTLEHIRDEFMYFNSYDVQQFVLGTVFIAPFASLFRERASTTNAIASLIIQGTTGDGKTAMATLAQSFFGQVREDNLASFNSTPKSVNELGHKFRDALFVIDDLKWATLGQTVQQQVKQMLQAYADGHGRDRLIRGAGGEYEPETGKEILGTIMISAEDLPTGESSFFGRYMVVHVKGRKEDSALLKRCLDESKHYSMVMAAYIQSFLRENNGADQLLGRFEHYKSLYEKAVPPKMVNTIRVCSQLALNMVGYETFLKFAESEGVLKREEVDWFKAEHFDRLLSLRDERLHEIKDETPAEKFIAMVKELLATGRCRLEGQDGNGAIVGFEEKGVLYLIPNITLGEVQKCYATLNERIPFGLASLSQQLASQGYLAARGSDRPAILKSHRGRKQRYFAIDVKKIEFHDDEKPQA